VIPLHEKAGHNWLERECHANVRVTLAVAWPTRVSGVAARTATRQRVKVTGSGTRTIARPSASVSSAGAQKAVSGKSLRGVAAGPSPPPTPSSQRTGRKE
jgi:hypothetical protein